MRWDLFGGGLAVFSVGLAIFLGWPPGWLGISAPEVVDAGVYFGICLMIVGTPIFLASFSPIRAMWPELTIAAAVVIFVVGAVGLYLRSVREERLPPHPSVMASFAGADDPGPYVLSILNPQSNPFINATMRVRVAGLITYVFNDPTINLGDIEYGISVVPNLRLPLGYYQIDIRYRGGRITEMLHIAYTNGRLNQYSWFSNGSRVVEKPQGPTPPLPIYQFSNKPATDGRIFDCAETTLLAARSAQGLELQYFALNAANLATVRINARVTQLTLQINGTILNVVNGGGIFQRVERGENLFSQWSVPFTIPPGTEKVIATFEIAGDTVPASGAHTLREVVEYVIDWQNDQPTIKSNIVSQDWL